MFDVQIRSLAPWCFQVILNHRPAWRIYGKDECAPEGTTRGVDPKYWLFRDGMGCRQGVGWTQYWPIRGIMLLLPPRHTQQSLTSIWHSTNRSIMTNSMKRRTKMKASQVWSLSRAAWWGWRWRQECSQVQVPRQDDNAKFPPCNPLLTPLALYSVYYFVHCILINTIHTNHTTHIDTNYFHYSYYSHPWLAIACCIAYTPIPCSAHSLVLNHL